MSICLFIDTSIFGASMAIAELEKGNILWQEYFPERKGSASILSKLWEKGSAHSNVNPKNIDSIAISIGPGSFTGIKVGLAWAYGFSLACNKNLKWFSLSAIEEATNKLLRDHKKNLPISECAVFLASTKSHGYLTWAPSSNAESQSFPVDTKSILVDTTSTLPSELKETLKLQKSGSSSLKVFWASEWQEMASLISKPDAKNIFLTPEQVIKEAMQGMISKATSLGLNGASLNIPEACYLRKSSAEENLDKKKGQH